MSHDLSSKKQAGLLQIGNNVFINSNGSISNGGNSLTVSQDALVLPHSVITQEPDIDSSVSVSGSAGIITTVSSSLAALGVQTFTVSNSSVSPESVIVVSTVSYTGTYGTDGIPVVSVSSIVQGGFEINIVNAHATAPLDGSLSISFIIV